LIDVAELASVVPAHGYAPAGLPVLRDAIAQRHHALAAPTSPAQIHVTNGAQHALDLALGAVAKRGDMIAVEDPTYVGIRDLLRGRGLRALPLPLDLIDDPGDQLSKLLIAGHARAVLLIPAVHSPTGMLARGYFAGSTLMASASLKVTSTSSPFLRPRMNAIPCGSFTFKRRL